MKQKPLGDKQKGILASLVYHKSWHRSFRCGWVWDTPSGTIKLLESLIKRGLVKKENIEGHDVYTPTEEGINETKKR